MKKIALGATVAVSVASMLWILAARLFNPDQTDMRVFLNNTTACGLLLVSGAIGAAILLRMGDAD